jgi:magnesium-transporting ATPase (P-type)
LATVRRDGQVQTISAEQIVPGDVVILDSGDIITADLHLLEAAKLQVNDQAQADDGAEFPFLRTRRVSCALACSGRRRRGRGRHGVSRPHLLRPRCEQ